MLRVANNHISTMGDGKVLQFEDVRDISTKEGFDRFLKKTGLFTKSARQHLAKLLPKQSDSDSREISLITSCTEEMKKFTQSLRG